MVLLINFLKKSCLTHSSTWQLRVIPSPQVELLALTNRCLFKVGSVQLRMYQTPLADVWLGLLPQKRWKGAFSLPI